MEEMLIAPCGMNCAVCVSFQTMKQDLKAKGFSKSGCPGCRPRGKNCTYLKKHCVLLGEGRVQYCFECPDFSCEHLKALDQRYRTKYHMSMISNLTCIRDRGIQEFLRAEEEKWRCPACGGEICCHNGLCLHCSADILKSNPTYRWGSSPAAASGEVARPLPVADEGRANESTETSNANGSE